MVALFVIISERGSKKKKKKKLCGTSLFIKYIQTAFLTATLQSEAIAKSSLWKVTLFFSISYLSFLRIKSI